MRIVFHYFYFFRITSTAAPMIAMTATPTAAYVTSEGRPVVSVICCVEVIVLAGAAVVTVVV